MKKLSKASRLMSLLITGLLIMTLVGCGKNDQGTESSKTVSSTKQTSTKAEEINVSVSLIQDEKELNKKTIKVAKDSNLMEAVQENFDVKEKDGMITSIDGVEQNTADGIYWTYTINDEMINTGAKDTPLADGDKVVFTYAKF